jgi:hypothetical protein
MCDLSDNCRQKKSESDFDITRVLHNESAFQGSEDVTLHSLLLPTARFNTPPSFKHAGFPRSRLRRRQRRYVDIFPSARSNAFLGRDSIPFNTGSHSSTTTIADATSFSLPRVTGNFASCLTLPREQTLQIFCTDEYRKGAGKVNEEAEVAVRPHPTHARKRHPSTSPGTRAVEGVFFSSFARAR